ncbi:hypothetical protein SCHPADRAFT_672289 [Schizopora paradoxa]|uniref:Uncharacterized protein n=1 Tax=Schizopora paradoxa TaxID=27342 RepID=A0A0H2R528_9AGAM|nr:hypothetical protein SCHPADRAFT_672289 [Schizopora paradoxa]
MVQDGIGYFACTLAITSANLAVELLKPELRSLLFITQGALQNILCSRLLFHLRDVNESPEDTLGVEDLTTIRYNAFSTIATESEGEQCARKSERETEVDASDMTVVLETTQDRTRCDNGV